MLPPRLLIVTAMVVGLTFDLTQGHSWITCTDYLEMNGYYWNATKCRAFPRNGFEYTQKNQFGLDRGYNYQPGDSGPACRDARDDGNAYTNDYPMAVYYPGQTVVITHPTKNHVADVRCTNKYIPDSGNKIYISPRNAATDPSMSTFKQSLLTDLGVAPVGWTVEESVTTVYPKPGYQNAPKFCENMDKALATNNFTIPEDLRPGRYTFVWAWWFNSAGSGDLYTSCWEADVKRTRRQRDNTLNARGLTTESAIDKMTGLSLDGQGNQGNNQGNQGNNQGNQGTNQGNQGNQGTNQGNQGNQGTNQGNQGNQGTNQGNQGNQGTNQGNQGNQGSNQGGGNCQGNSGTGINIPGGSGQAMKCTCMCEAP